ncbi:hypothetical protein CHLRE_09g387504v5 [Chlamydomonas reinhardtii]|uniref:Uncharacterized protein n=1 Tax=Chlamydomonas reinhardtii TaxID=3055 RepID=A8J124_CHLRE|nr:uncharacterized protein CHLRE_09g387504v5 [Chlamydomonas reinhardtii]PNW78710.1 hypothetical protein CHLRE_09g387504v5 [Chlamydomonas reinhardtii]|eukprot:XP_001695038.1 predicted protein [Chlamydomonas reinhardtii]
MEPGGNSVLLGPWVTVFSLVALLLINGVVWLVRRHKNATTGVRRARLNAEIGYLRRESAKLNAPATYAKCAKFQRLANAKDKELAELTAAPAVPGLGDRMVLLANAVKLLAVGAASLWLWDTPVAQVAPRSLLSPLGGLLAFPRGSELAPFGVITLTPWLFVADSATKSLVRAVFPTPSAGSTGVAALDVEQLTREADAAGRIRPYSAAAAAASAAASTQG